MTNVTNILKSMQGRDMGLGPKNELIVNQSQLGLPANSQGLVEGVAKVTVTSAQLLALNATPQTLVAAPGAGLILLPRKVAIHKPAGTAYAGIAAGEDLAVKYTDGSGAQALATVETTGFLDQTTAETRVSGELAASLEPVANAAIVLHLLVGEIITGDSDLLIWLWYDAIPSPLTVGA